MIPSVAPQHPDSETLSPSVLNELLAARARSMESGKSMIRTLASRASRVLAVAVLAAAAGYLLLSVAQPGPGLAAAPSAEAASPADAATAAPGPLQPVAESPLELEQRAVTEYIAKRYRVSEQAVAGYVSLAYHAGGQYSIDPLLILAVMAIESRYNPVAESNMGARGLMQVIPKYHLEKLLDHGGEPALLDPAVNIVVGTQILREYQRRFRDTETALQMYAGALDDATTQYASKVFAEKARLDALRVKTKRTGQSV